ncbi:hypothetical protein GCM10017600_08840 [Streptosporangium carneum]|uniref:Uncharacterized protein n=1 Tax=Streptosporangium carneum TaxID=47481 RepID=A0A9W6MAM8_9ACTN|nr:hypothetical protein GCM10017600_08840 [Streptosporangium carneum]
MTLNLKSHATTVVGHTAVLVLVLSGCGVSALEASGSPSTPPNSPAVRFLGDDPRILVHRLPEPMEAPVEGRLGYDKEGACLVIEDWGGAGAVGIPVWHEGVKPIRKQQKAGIQRDDGLVLLEGDRFTASGGMVRRTAKEFAHLKASSWCSKAPDHYVVINDDVKKS